MKRSLIFAAVLTGLAAVTPGCSSGRVYGGPPARYRAVRSAFDEGFRLGLIDGRAAGRRDFGRPYRRDFWDDGRYRRGSEGYRPRYGSRTEYADGYRAGYERGYRDERDRERHRHEHR